MKRHFVVKASKSIRASKGNALKSVRNVMHMLAQEYGRAAVESGNISDTSELVDMGDPLYTDDQGYLQELSQFVLDNFPEMERCTVNFEEESEIEVTVFDRTNTVVGRVVAWYSNGRFGFDIV